MMILIVHCDQVLKYEAEWVVGVLARSFALISDGSSKVLVAGSFYTLRPRGWRSWSASLG